MPIYEYECSLCSFRFEKRQKFDAEPVARCPKCQGKASRIFHPAPIIFKGGGFYVTDNRKGGATRMGRGKEKLPGKKKGEAGGESTTTASH